MIQNIPEYSYCYLNLLPSVLLLWPSFFAFKGIEYTAARVLLCDFWTRLMQILFILFIAVEQQRHSLVTN